MSLETSLNSRKESRRNLHNGRDEMNLCEVPFATLSERTTAKIVNFTVNEYDVELKQDVERTYTISGHVEYGLPTAKDEDIYLGLLKQTLDYNQFRNALVHFNRSELFEILDWRKKDWAYDRLELGLHRLAAVRITCRNAWRDNRNKEWCDKEDFGILDSFKLRDMRKSNSRKAFEEYSSQFIWGSVIFDSFDAGYLKKLDLGIVRQLHSVAARRLYRFLDKRFYPPKRMRIEMAVPLVAYEHIGVSRKTPVDKVIKRYLQPAAEELEHVGFLRPASHEQRFFKHKQEWRVVFNLRTKTNTSTTRHESGHSRLAVALVKRGVSEKAAYRHLKQYEKQSIVNAAKAFDEQKLAGTKVENADRWFATALQRAFEPNEKRGSIRQVTRPERLIYRSPNREVTKQGN